MKFPLFAALAAACLCLPLRLPAAVGFGDPQILASPALPATDGTTVTLTAQAQPDSGFALYLWFKDGVSLSNGGRISGATTNKLVLKGIQKADEGAYRVQVREVLTGGGVDDPVFSDPIDVAVNVRPIITAQPVAPAAVIQQDGTLSLSVGISAQSAQPLTFEWQRNNVPIDSMANPSAATETFTILARDPMNPVAQPGVQWADAGSYRVRVTNATGINVFSKPVKVAVASAAVLLSDLPAEFFIATKAKGKLSVLAGGTPKLSYQWSIDGEGNVLKGGTAASISIAGTPENDGKVFRVTVTNAATDGEHPAAVSGGATIRVINKLAATLVTGSLGMDTYQKGFTFDKGTAPVLEVQASLDGTGDLEYQWQKDGRDIADSATVTGTDERQLVFSDLDWADRGVYRCIVRNQVSVVTSKTFALGVNSPPVIVTEPAATNVAITGGKAVFTVIASGSGKLTYQWFKKDPGGDIPLPKATKNKLTLSKLLRNVSGDDYYCEVSNAFTATLGGGTPTRSADANLVVFDPVKIITHPQAPVNGVRVGNTLTLNVGITGDDPVVYEWYLNKKTRLANGPLGSATVSGADTEELQIDNMQPALQGSYSCIVRNAQIPGAPTPKYLANVSSKAAKVIVVIPPVITQQTNSTPVSPVTEEDLVTLSVQGDGTPPLKYQWQISDDGTTWSNLQGKTLNRLVFSKIQLGNDAYYRCIVNNILNEPAYSDPLSLDVLPIPAASNVTITPPVGRADEFIRITGQNLKYVRTVSILPAAGGTVNATFVRESDTSLLATIPGLAPTVASPLLLTSRGELSQTYQSAPDAFRRTVALENNYLNPRILVGTSHTGIVGDNTGLYDPVEDQSVAWYSWRPPEAGSYRVTVQTEDYDPMVVNITPDGSGNYTRRTFDSPVFDDLEIFNFTVTENQVGRDYFFGISAFIYPSLPDEGPFAMELTRVGGAPLVENSTVAPPSEAGSITRSSTAATWQAEGDPASFSLTTTEEGLDAVRLGGTQTKSEPVILFNEELPQAPEAASVRLGFHAGLDRIGEGAADLFAWQVSSGDGSPLLQLRLNSATGAIELVQADGRSVTAEPVLVAGSAQYFVIDLDLVQGVWSATMNGTLLSPAQPLPAGAQFGELSAIWYPSSKSGSAVSTMTFDRVNLELP